ncbi:MAG TPA: hypothetical protein VF251_14705, partial [Pyrinomonadaceae bacterium]
GNWSKWDNGSWNGVERPDQSVRDSMMNERGRQQDRAAQRDGARGDRMGDSSRTQQMDRSTYQNLERDRSARREGSQRSRDFGTYNRSSSPSRSSSSAGSFRGGGFSRGGGGFRGGGRR